MEVPEEYVIEAYRRLDFLLRPDPDDHDNLVFDDGQGMVFFHPVLDGGLMELEFIVLDIEGTEGTMGMEAGWAHRIWLPTLAEVLQGTEFELDVDYTTED